MREIDNEKLEQAARLIIEGLGDDPEREGLVETPKRLAKMYRETFEGMKYTNDEIAEMYDKCFEDLDTGDLVVESHIPIFSTCEHHLALMYDMYVHIGYIPNRKVIGLSKLARVATMCGKRLQLQERIGTDIVEVLSKILETDDIIVVIEGSHACMTSRGIKSREAKTRTAAIRGKFYTDSDLRSEFYKLAAIK